MFANTKPKTHTHRRRNTQPKTQTLSPFSFWGCRNLPGFLAWEKRKVAVKGGLNLIFVDSLLQKLVGILGCWSLSGGL
jgi:hypothetical protein